MVFNYGDAATNPAEMDKLQALRVLVVRTLGFQSSEEYAANRGISNMAAGGPLDTALANEARSHGLSAAANAFVWRQDPQLTTALQSMLSKSPGAPSRSAPGRGSDDGMPGASLGVPMWAWGLGLLAVAGGAYLYLK